MKIDDENFELLRNLSDKLFALHNIIANIYSDGFLAPSILSELADNELIDVVDEINSKIPTIVEILENKINELNNQIKDL